LLISAWRPQDIDPQLNELLIQQALEDPLAEPSREELAEAEALRAALETNTPHPDAELARALRAANTPAEISVERVPALVERATATKGNVIFVTFGAASLALAAAAALMLVFQPSQRAPAPSTVGSSYALSRSTAPLFESKFERQETSRRVDRIASARARELRANRYAAWGVR